MHIIVLWSELFLNKTNEMLIALNTLKMPIQVKLSTCIFISAINAIKLINKTKLQT